MLIKLDITEKQLKEVLLPGDKIKVSILSKNKVIKTCDSAIVIDILNDNGISIFDVYYELFTLSRKKQEELFLNNNFQKNIVPSNILLKVTELGYLDYNNIKKEELSYEITLLNEIEENIVLKALNDLKKRFSDK
ncbi:TPA: hypothetical protein KPJ62_003664 [Clostridioides difficile]|nr:hypothetical protein [Clostridioides difficile]